jgi:D-serine deaminase-like pyridoxal phosphate-dependent protein
LGVSHRPHLKTSKCVDVAKHVFGGKYGPITVSTLAEAFYFFDAGFRDIMYAVGINPNKLFEVKALLEKGADLKIILDCPIVAHEVARFGAANSLSIPTLIELNCDDHRAGLEPLEPATLETAKILHESKGTDFLGVMTHAGASYNCKNIEAIIEMAEIERKAVVGCAGLLNSNGIPTPIVSVGSTPTAIHAKNLKGVTEVRAGVYIFFDLFQHGIGICQFEDIALSVLSTVIGHKKTLNRIIIDAGGMALSKDRGTGKQKNDRKYGLLGDVVTGKIIKGLIVKDVSQEHGMITSLEGDIDFSKYPIGSKIRIFPNHACMTAAAHEKYYVVSGESDEIIAEWQRCMGW